MPTSSSSATGVIAAAMRDRASSSCNAFVPWLGTSQGSTPAGSGDFMFAIKRVRPWQYWENSS
jgi:hypothetical protein